MESMRKLLWNLDTVTILHRKVAIPVTIGGNGLEAISVNYCIPVGQNRRVARIEDILYVSNQAMTTANGFPSA
jgi:hypothetical protein